MLVKGDIDLMLEQLPFADDIAYYTLGEDHLYLLVTDEYLKNCFGPDFSHVKSILISTGRIQVLEPCNFLLNKTGNTIRSAMNSIFQSEKMAVKVGVESNNLETLYNLVYPGNFLSDRKLTDNLNAIQLNYPSASYTLGIGYMNGHYLSNAAKDLIRLMEG